MSDSILNDHVRNNRRDELLSSAREYLIIATYHHDHESP